MPLYIKCKCQPSNQETKPLSNQDLRPPTRWQPARLCPPPVNARRFDMKRLLPFLILAALFAIRAHAAGTLTPKTSTQQPIQIVSHEVNVVIDNGFARTEVTQLFHNPNDSDVEAVYSFPVPKSASLSEITIWSGDREMNGEVVAADQIGRAHV